MPNAIGYVRVSTTDQATEGISLDTQRARIEAWCVANDYTLVEVYKDAGLSASKTHTRPGLRQALDDACAKQAALVVYSLSRLARSTLDAIAISDRLGKAGADLVSLSEKLDTTSAAGKMMFRMMAVLAEFERDVIAERTKGALAHLRRQGKRISRHLPYGFDLAPDGCTLVKNPAEWTVLVDMRVLRKRGHSYHAIADTLTAKGIPAKQGGVWHAFAVQQILQRDATARKTTRAQ